MDKNQVEQVIDGLTPKERAALDEAISVIYFTDSADYINGLWGVVRAILGDAIDTKAFHTEKVFDYLNRDKSSEEPQEKRRNRRAFDQMGRHSYATRGVHFKSLKEES